MERKTDGCQMFLSMETLDVQLVTAKSSEMNLMVPNGKELLSQFQVTFGKRGMPDSQKKPSMLYHNKYDENILAFLSKN